MKSALLVVLSAVSLVGMASAVTTGSVVLENGMFKFQAGIAKNPIAVGSFTDQLENVNASGFGELTISTYAVAGSTMTDQFGAAGYLEGVLTFNRMWEHYSNILSWMDGNFQSGTLPASFEAWFDTQDKWARSQVAAFPNDPRWVGVGALLAQLDGLVAGYNSVASSSKQLTLYQLQLVQATGDVLDLIPALSPSDAPAWHSMKPHEVMAAVRARSHCSGLIKGLGDLSELFVAQVAWFTYGSMNRIYKTYDVAGSFPGSIMSFSSYPGLLSSLDDFYMMSPSNLTMIQTTNNVFNMSLYQFVKPQSLLAWQRVRLANLLADNGEDWVEYIRLNNSGTYNNAYMVVDYKRYTPGHSLSNGTLWYSEQIPGLVMGDDVTDTLARGYWPSYNVPYFEEIYRLSGYPEVIESASKNDPTNAEQLSGLDYQLAARAKLFRRDQGTVVDLSTFQDLMRSNNYKTDPYSKGSAWNAICSRGDLAQPPSPDGCYDGKVTSSALAGSLQAWIVNGPTTSQGTLPPFSWIPRYNSTLHLGQFDTFDFSWQLVSPHWT